MTENLIEMLGKQMTPGVMGALGKAVGQNDKATQSAMSAILPSLVGAMSQKGRSEAGAGELLDLVGGQSDSLDMSDFAGLVGNEGSRNQLMGIAGPIMSMLMPGSRSNSIMDLVGRQSGMNASASSSLMKMVAPFVMRMIMKKVMGGGRNRGQQVSGLMDLMKGQDQYLKDSAPEGLADALGISGFGMDADDNVRKTMDSTRDRVDTTRDRVVQETKTSGGGLPGWLIPLLGVLALLAIGWMLMRGRGGSTVPAAVCTSSTTLMDRIDGIGAIDANTDTEGLIERVGGVSTAFGAISGAVGNSNIPGLSGLTDAVENMDDLVNNISTPTLGDSAGVVGEAFDKLETGATEFMDSSGCEN